MIILEKKMISIKEKGLPETDRTYLVLATHYEPEPFEAYLDDNSDWWDCRVPRYGLSFVYAEVTHYEPVDILEDLNDLDND